MANNLLGNIRIASPCSASWEKMSGDDRIRRCQECRLNVYNLSEMTRLEAERLIAAREGRLCVRFYRRVDGTILTRDCPEGLRASIRRISRAAGAALSALMTTGFAFAQSAGKPSPNTAAQTEQKLGGISLTVFDPSGATVSGAEVSLFDDKGEKMRNAIADGNGKTFFRIAPGVYSVSVSARFFQTKSQTVRVDRDQLSLEVTLPLAAIQGEVVIVDQGSEPTINTLGDLTIPLYPIQPLKKEKKQR